MLRRIILMLSMYCVILTSMSFHNTFVNNFNSAIASESYSETSCKNEDFNQFSDQFFTDIDFRKTRVLFPFKKTFYDDGKPSTRFISKNEMIEGDVFHDVFFLNYPIVKRQGFDIEKRHKPGNKNASVVFRLRDTDEVGEYLFIKTDFGCWKLVEHVSY